MRHDATQNSLPTSEKPALASSRILGFAKLSARGRLEALAERGVVANHDISLFQPSEGLPLECAEGFIENCIGHFSLPLGIATNFLVDGREVLVPMAVEESSVVAAASHGAKLVRSGGGFVSDPTETIATCQIQVTAPLDFRFANFFEEERVHLEELANACHPKLVERGGGVRELELRPLRRAGHYAIHVHVDTREAMGANIVNTIAEELGSYLAATFGARFGIKIGLKILTNLTVKRLTTVRCEVTPAVLAIAGFSGEEAIDRIVDAAAFAEMDPFRAATHNKGIMNGIDPVVIATGNDWRAVEAGCHAYAATQAHGYSPLTRWEKSPEGTLLGQITAPIAVGTVGGVTKLHPTARTCLRMLGNPSSSELSAVIASVGLAQNLSALRALACEGIQRGHMALHEKNIEMMRRYDHLPQLHPVDRS
jgi:hydroxymethylglutaryl-CoA reductase